MLKVAGWIAAVALLGRLLRPSSAQAAPPAAGGPSAAPEPAPPPLLAPAAAPPPAPPGSRTGRRAARLRMPAALAVVAAAVVGVLALLGSGDGEVPPAAAPPAAAGPPAGSAEPDRVPIGVYIDPGDRAGFESFATWLGRRPLLVSDGLEERRWSFVVDPWWLLDAWRDVDARIVYSLVMIPREEGGTLQRGAAGEYDGYFRELAERLVEGGQASAILRPGWEFSGDWQPWSARSDPGAWKAYYRRIVEAMRSVPGADFQFVWNPALGPIDPTNWPAERAWPGREWVDLVGVDPYDICFSEGTYPIPDEATAAEARDRRAACWRELLTGERGLRWYADFAERHRRPLVIPEFGLVPLELGGGGDNPIFIRGMARFARANDVEWLVYFNKADAELGNHRIDDDTYPRSSAVFRSLYGPDPPRPARAGAQPPPAATP